MTDEQFLILSRKIDGLYHEQRMLFRNVIANQLAYTGKGTPKSIMAQAGRIVDEIVANVKAGMK